MTTRFQTRWPLALAGLASLLAFAPPAAGASPSPTPTPAPALASAMKDPLIALRERVTVVGSPEGLFEIPGAAQEISGAMLDRRQQGFDDIHRLLRPIPGVVIQEEEGFGHRPNIGMRGSGTDRSAKITLMEDGVLIAPAPYSAPAAYYFPLAGRMEGIEVRKGSSQVKYGPNTVGGALNLISTSVPSAFRVRARIEGGQAGSGKLHANIGDSGDRFGWLFETYQGLSKGFKQLDGGGDTGFRLQDYMGKARVSSARGSRRFQLLELKLGATEDDSDETYLGLSDGDFKVTPKRRYAASQLDSFESSHRQVQLRHFLSASRFDVTTTIWRNDFKRSWYKLESVQGANLGNVLANPSAFPVQFATLRGVDSAANALIIRNNNRIYFSHGAETVLAVRATFGATHNSFEAGLRYVEDEEDRFQQDDAYAMTGGLMNLTRAGAPGSQTNQVVGASAWAFFMQDRLTAGRLTLVPGFRVESIDLRREDFLRTDPARATPPTILDDNVSVFVPGLGASLRLSESLHAIGGVHKGFAPPGPGANVATRAEESINYEAGLRARSGSLRAELIGFFNNYENLLGRDTLATGGTGSGDQFNGGEVRVHGLEAAMSANLQGLLGAKVSVPLSVTYTFTRGRFKNAFQSQYGPWGAVAAKDEVPYLPAHQLFASIGVSTPKWLADLSANYVAATRTRAGQGALDPATSTERALVLDALGEYVIDQRLRVYASVQNVANRSYIVARQPAGARPGLPRMFTVGLKLGIGN